MFDLNHYNDLTNINNSLTASDSLKFRFATDGEGNYGFLGADGSLIPFKSDEELSVSIATSLYMYGVGGDYKHSASFTTTLTVKKSDGTILLSKSITGNTGRVRDRSDGSCSNSGTYNITV